MLFAAAAELAGSRLSSLAELRRRDHITENQFLQPTYRQALEEVAAQARPSPSVSPTLSHGLKRQWPRLGNFDVSLAWGAKATVFGELKCGSDEDTLSACGWDAIKCAFCLRHGVGTAMLLVATAPAELWRTRGLGLELLDDAEWDVADIRRRYAKGFRKWEIDGYKPLQVPSRVTTSLVARSEFLIAGKLWVLGIARVEPLEEEWLTWIPFLPVSHSAVLSPARPLPPSARY
jgi:hypothetical protein